MGLYMLLSLLNEMTDFGANLNRTYLLIILKSSFRINEMLKNEDTILRWCELLIYQK